jgi:hypothetical protein
VQGFVGNAMDEKIAYYWIHDWRKRAKAESQIV